MGLLAKANDDVLLSIVDARRASRGEPRIPTEVFAGGKPGGGEQRSAGEGGAEECKGEAPGDAYEGGDRGDSGWSIGPSGRGIPFGLVARLATREDLESAMLEMEPPLLRPDMPRCHAKDLRVPKTYREARDGEHRVYFMDAAKQEVFGLLDAEAFKVVDE